MKTSFKGLRARGGVLLVLTVAALAASGGAQAGGTTAGTVINNKATLNYSVGGVGTVLESAPAGGNTTTGSGNGTSTSFMVDNKINHTVVTTDVASLNVEPNQTSVVRNFTITNTGNYPQGYLLTVANVNAGQAVLGTNDDADLVTSSCVISVNGTPATAISSLNPDVAPVPITVACSIPASAADNQHIAIALVAQATTANTATPVSQTTGAGTMAGMDVVFADIAGAGLPSTVDDARDGKASGLSAYHVATAVLRVTKAVVTQCDPLNGATNPKNIPGAYVRYTITVLNNGTAPAKLTSITDTLDGAVQFDKDLLRANSVARCNAGTVTESSGTDNGFSLSYPQRGFSPKYMTTGANSDGATHSDPTQPGGTITINFTEAMPAAGSYGDGELKPNESLSITYQVLVR